MRNFWCNQTATTEHSPTQAVEYVLKNQILRRTVWDSAYCERQPLTPEQSETMTYEIVSKVSADSCGGDKEAYQQFLASQQSKQYVQI